MERVIVESLYLMLAVVVSGWAARALRFPVPLPLVQIGAGGLIAATTPHGMRLDPEVFFLLFLPPLLFLDGWRIPKEGLFRDARTIVGLAFGLVVASVVAIGFVIHWMIPAMPLAVAFALAAGLSPTDPVAVGAIIKKSPLPRRILHVLEGESLLNDATGLVCMRFAVAAVATGSFSLGPAAASFLWLALAGLAAGAGITFGVTAIQSRIALRLGEESGSKILMSLLLPFGAYLLAERIHASGILAAVAAGVAMAYVEQTGRALPATRMRRIAVWDMLQFALNGTMFVLLGEQLPNIVRNAARAMEDADLGHPPLILVYVAAVSAAMILLRLGWLWFAFRLPGFRRGGPPMDRRVLLAAAIAGVRGSITLAAIMTLPLFVNGAPFPGRDLAIVIAAGVVILSMLLAGLVLPPLLASLPAPVEEESERFERRARKAASLAAIDAIERALHGEHVISPKTVTWMEAAARISGDYRARIEGMGKSGEEADELRRAEAVDRELRLAGLRAERETYYRLGRERKLSDDIVRRLVAEVDHAETRLG